MRAISVKLQTIVQSPVTRVDASYQLSEGVQTRQLIDSLPFPKTTCKKVASSIFHAGRWKRVYVNNPAHGVTLLGSSSMLNADLNDEKMVSIKYTDGILEKTLKKGWILISCSGTIGKTAFTNAGHAGKLASQDVIRLVPNDILGAGYIYAYLSTKYGYTMLTQGTFGAVIQHIEPANVETIPIPLFPKEFRGKVDEMIQESARLREEAAIALDKAHALIETAIPFKAERRSHSVSIRDIMASTSSRLEATSFVSEAKGLHDAIIKQLPYQPLLELTDDVFTEGIFKREYVANGVPFMSGSDILRAIPTNTKCLSRRQAKKMPHLYVERGWLLVTCSGSVGDVAYVDEQLTRFIYTHDLIRIKPKDEDTQHYLFGFLSSRIGHDLINLYKYGSVIQHVDASQVSSMPIPLIEDCRKEIIALSRDYVEKIEKSKRLELEAIAMVETKIEQMRVER